MRIIKYNKTNWEDYLNITNDFIIRVEDNIMVVSNSKGQDIINLNRKNIFNNNNLSYPYKHVNHFKNNVAIVTNKDDTDSLITTDQIKIATYQDIYYLEDNLYLVKKDSKFGIINNQGTIIAPIKYEKITDFDQGYAQVTLNKLVGLINKKGKEVIPPTYESISEIKDGKVIVTNDKKGLRDLNDNVLINNKYLDIFFTYDNQLIVKKSRKRYLKTNYQGKIIKNLHLRKYSVLKILNGFILVSPSSPSLLTPIDFTSKVLDSDGREIENHVYNFFIVSHDKIIINKFAVGTKFINDTKTIQSGFYDHITKITDNRLLTQIRHNVGLIDGTGKEILKPIYSIIKLITEDLFLVSKEMPLYNTLINSQGKVLASYSKHIDSFHNGYAIFYDDTKTGLINMEGKELYSSKNVITDFYRKGNLIIIYYKDHLDLIDVNGRKILENVRESVYILNDQQLIINGSLIDIESIEIKPVYYVPELDTYFSTREIAQKHIEKEKIKSLKSK